MEKYYPTFSDTLLSQLEKCAEVVGVKTPSELAEFDSMHATIKEVAKIAGERWEKDTGGKITYIMRHPFKFISFLVFQISFFLLEFEAQM